MLEELEEPELQNPVLIKLGGSVITDKEKEFTTREDVIKRLADEIAAAKIPAIIIHGAGSYGHGLAKKYGLHFGMKERIQYHMFSFLRIQMDELRQIISQALFDVGLNPFPIQPSAIITTLENEVFHFDDHSLLQSLRMGFTPVLHGDAVLDYRKGSSIISGDLLCQILARYLGPTRCIFVTDVEGIYDKDPKTHPDAELLEVLRIGDVLRLIKSGDVGESLYDDVTEGMRGKLKEILPIVDSGSEVAVINGTRDGALYNVLVGGEERGTFIYPK